LRQYYRDHALGDTGETVSRYVAFALVAGPPPKFAVTIQREELPPDVLTLEGFSEILANFYQEAQIEQRWRVFQPVYKGLATRLDEPLGGVTFTETTYLRELLRPGPRTFTVIAEPLVGPRTSFRNIGDRYVVVADPSSDSVDEIGHAFLHFLLDPLPLRYSDQLVVQSQLMQIAGRAPRLPAEYRNDWAAFFAECLVRAAELRLQRLTPQQLAAEINAAEGDGYVLVRPLVAALVKFEASEPSITLYFPELARSIDTASEQARLKTVVFAPASDSAGDSAPGDGAGATAAANADPEIEDALNEGERFIAAQQAPAAAAAFERVLAKVPGQPRALYGLAVASVLQGNGARARELFEQVVAAAPSDGNVLAWSHVYLGRMNDMAGSRADAMDEYKAALAVASAPEGARSAAQRGIDQAYQPVTPDTRSE
jgi:tetratricopeptide (TPR) repeat protein